MAARYASCCRRRACRVARKNAEKNSTVESRNQADRLVALVGITVERARLERRAGGRTKLRHHAPFASTVYGCRRTAESVAANFFFFGRSGSIVGLNAARYMARRDCGHILGSHGRRSGWPNRSAGLRVLQVTESVARPTGERDQTERALPRTTKPPDQAEDSSNSRRAGDAGTSRRSARRRSGRRSGRRRTRRSAEPRCRGRAPRRARRTERPHAPCSLERKLRHRRGRARGRPEGSAEIIGQELDSQPAVRAVAVEPVGLWACARNARVEQVPQLLAGDTTKYIVQRVRPQS
jgi:hypothetical protein